MPNPLPPVIGPVTPEGGSGAGYTDENRIAGERDSNEDRGGSFSGPALRSDAAEQFLTDLFRHRIVPRTSAMEAGSTLSMAMRTEDGGLACAYIGDSPIYLITANDKGEVRLEQMSIPHTEVGGWITEELKRTHKDPMYNWRQAFEEIAKTDGFMADTIRKKVPDGRMSHCLGWNGQCSGPAYPAEVYSFHPQVECEDGFTYKGVMIASDGIENGVRNGKVQEALQQQFDNAPSPSPEDLSKAAVEAAARFTTDNVTAMVMTNAQGKAGDLIVVADGNTGSADVADAAVQCIREACREHAAAPPGPSVSSPGIAPGDPSRHPGASPGP